MRNSWWDHWAISVASPAEWTSGHWPCCKSSAWGSLQCQRFPLVLGCTSAAPSQTMSGLPSNPSGIGSTTTTGWELFWTSGLQKFVFDLSHCIVEYHRARLNSLAAASQEACLLKFAHQFVSYLKQFFCRQKRHKARTNIKEATCSTSSSKFVQLQAQSCFLKCAFVTCSVVEQPTLVLERWNSAQEGLEDGLDDSRGWDPLSGCFFVLIRKLM